MSDLSLVSGYATLLVAAFILIGAEVYVPGGVLGAFGVACLAAAAVLGFLQGPVAGWAGLGLILALAVVGGFFWLKVFPNTRAGRRLSLGREGTDVRVSGPSVDLAEGQAGIALSALRPAGIARIGGRRVDVLAENGVWIKAGTALKVTRVVSGRPYVEAQVS